MKFIEWHRGGMSREVFCIGRWALKVPKLTRGLRNFLIGLLANMQEQDLWKQHRWPQLCPVIFHIRPVLVVMPRTVPLTTEQAASDAHLALLETDDGLFIPAEPKGDSFGVLDGRIVIVDYGDRPD